jgi:hypothetical protein
MEPYDAIAGVDFAVNDATGVVSRELPGSEPEDAE